MDLTFEGGFPLTAFTKQVGQPQPWNGKWADFGQQQSGTAHTGLYWYEIPVLCELANQQHMYF
jgi:hypothetical protein